MKFTKRVWYRLRWLFIRPSAGWRKGYAMGYNDGNAHGLDYPDPSLHDDATLQGAVDAAWKQGYNTGMSDYADPSVANPIPLKAPPVQPTAGAAAIELVPNLACG